jgi:hypothetical protein
MNALKRIGTVTAMGSLALASIDAAPPQDLAVRIIDQQSNETHYSYVLPARSATNSTGGATCSGNAATVSCTGSAATTESSMPARAVSYNVSGATLSLLLPDSRIAIVNCESKAPGLLKIAVKVGTEGRSVANRRGCRTPLVKDIHAEFDGDKPKLKWPVSLDGKTIETETYRILGIVAGQ